MCDYGDYVEKMGTEKGLQRGILQGKEEERINSTLNAIQSLMKTLKLSADEAMDALQIPADKKTCYLELLKKR